MKCDEFKPLVFSLNALAYVDERTVEKNFENPHDHAVYKATEVDSAIAELKAELAEKDKDIAYWRKEYDEETKLTDALNAEIENIKASHYAEMVDAGMRERRLKHALWLARAELCHRLDVDRYLRNHRNSWYNENCLTWCDACVAMEVKMCNAERKCLAKAEQYK